MYRSAQFYCKTYGALRVIKLNVSLAPDCVSEMQIVCAFPARSNYPAAAGARAAIAAGFETQLTNCKEIDASQAEPLGRSCLSIVTRSRSHARHVRMSHAFSCVEPAFINL
ncbi:hypothetical protein EVAR_33437_1 [Eumeta japonica]|uniref:Uncharacterized protein n=1 Tax=Eumeta variegata TaxID=151549 RepID=A0A4C1W131_EUMVA|nr:hypothetical protein EVAR_33437_1 [Eumeta japonica]